MAENEKNELNPRQSKFVEGVISGKSIVDAYRAAGYKGKEDGNSVYACASEIFRKPRVKEEFEKRMEDKKAQAAVHLDSMIDGAKNIFIRIEKLDASNCEGVDSRILEIQRKTALDVFKLNGLKPPDKTELSGKVDHNVTFIDFLKEARRRKEAVEEDDNRTDNG